VTDVRTPRLLQQYVCKQQGVPERRGNAAEWRKVGFERLQTRLNQLNNLMKTILVPIDFSHPAKLAVEVAAEIAKKAGAEIILLNVIELPTPDSFNVEAQVADFADMEEKLFTMKLIEMSKKELSIICKALEKKGVKATFKLRTGNAFHGIRTAITDQQADLVVMGTSGRPRLEEMIIGSNTEKVIRHSKCPVLTVHEKASEPDFQSIVYATSMSDDELEFSKVIVNAQELYNATIHLVRVNTPMNFKSDFEIKRAMQQFATALQLKNYTVNVYNDYSEEEGIIHFADSIDADLIAMATHGRTGFAHVILGSIAEDVANHANRPVLTYVTKGKG
jgi:nucleotide-binding universal stress UspA family protein